MSAVRGRRRIAGFVLVLVGVVLLAIAYSTPYMDPSQYIVLQSILFAAGQLLLAIAWLVFSQSLLGPSRAGRRVAWILGIAIVLILVGGFGGAVVSAYEDVVHYAVSSAITIPLVVALYAGPLLSFIGLGALLLAATSPNTLGH